jgi:predicted nucleic acid-binding protein
VSGDKHLLKVGQYQGVKIVTPADFIEVMTERGETG